MAFTRPQQQQRQQQEEPHHHNCRTLLPPLPLPALDAVLTRLARPDAITAAHVDRTWAAAARSVLHRTIVFCHSGPPSQPPPMDRNTPPELSRFTLMLDLSLPHIWVRLGQTDCPAVCVKDLVLAEVPDYNAARVLRMLADAGAKPSRISLLRVQPSAVLAAALVPFFTGGGVTRFVFNLDQLAPDAAPSVYDAAGLVELARGLVSLVWQSARYPIPQALLMANRSSLRSLHVNINNPVARKALQRFLASGPRLASLRLAGAGSHANPVLESWMLGTSHASLKYLHLDDIRFFSTGFLSSLPNLDALRIDGRAVNKGDEMLLEDAWPPISLLELEFRSQGLLPVLAGAANVRSLTLSFPSPPVLQPHMALRCALDLAALPCFASLRTLNVSCIFKDILSFDHLGEIAALCPNLDTLVLRAALESLVPLLELRRLRRFALITNPVGFTLGKQLAALVQQRLDADDDDGPHALHYEPPCAFLMFSPYRRDDGVPLALPSSTAYENLRRAQTRTAQAIAGLTAGRLRVIEHTSELPF
ncbi:hypothetical protein HK405_012391 [Cladochytrium tenue]|nr:hypothetical protein HK405_012391 [Cladochytrium tenue]